jgi:uncharacterized protein (TIGR02453 family)
MDARFEHFPETTRLFLTGIAANNDKAWFDANRPLYEAGYVEAGKAFVAAIAPHLQALSPGVHAEPRVNGSIMRINRDVRFSKDKRPYKTHLDFWFWHGEKKGWNCPGFYLRITPETVFIGTGMHQFDKDMLDSYRHAVVLPRSGKALQAAIAKVQAAGDYEIGEKTRKKPPRGFEVDPDRVELLLHEGLTATKTLPASVAYQTGFVDLCATHLAATWPVGAWILAELSP